MGEDALIFSRISFFSGRRYLTDHLLQIGLIGWVFFILSGFPYSLDKEKITSWNNNGDIRKVVLDHFFERSLKLFCGIMYPLNQKLFTVFGGL